MIPLLLLALQSSRDVVPSDRPVELRVPIAGENQHRATVVTFPEESLEALVAGWNEGDLSVERRKDNLFLKLLRKAEGDVHVLGASGTLYRFSVRPAEGAYDGHVRVVRPAVRKHGTPEPVELIRAMRLGRRPAEGTVLRADGAVYAAADLRATLRYVYETDGYRGYVVRVENPSREPQRLEPSRFVGKTLVLAGAREMLLEPGGSTLLYLVFWKSP